MKRTYISPQYRCQLLQTGDVLTASNPAVMDLDDIGVNIWAEDD